MKQDIERFTCDKCGAVFERVLDRNRVPPPRWIHAEGFGQDGSYRYGDFCPTCGGVLLPLLKEMVEYQPGVPGQEVVATRRRGLKK